MRAIDVRSGDLAESRDDGPTERGSLSASRPSSHVLRFTFKRPPPDFIIDRHELELLSRSDGALQ